MQTFLALGGQVMAVLRVVVGSLLLVAVAAKAATMFGVRLPVAAPGPQELAYLAGAYWASSR